MMLIGYARVSTLDQDTALQRDALHRFGVERVFVESGSGVGPRPQLQVALSSLRAGDEFVVWKLDRIARGLPDLLSILSRIRAVGANIRSLTEPLDTASPLGEFMIQILGAVGQLERSMIRERVMAGQAAARARGKRWGPPRSLSDEVELAIVDRYLLGGVTQMELAREYGVGVGVIKLAIYRVVRPDAPYLCGRPGPRVSRSKSTIR